MSRCPGLEIGFRRRAADISLDRIVGLVNVVVDVQVVFLLEGKGVISLLFDGLLLVAMIENDAIAEHQTQLTGTIIILSDILFDDLQQMRLRLRLRSQEGITTAAELLGDGT